MRAILLGAAAAVLGLCPAIASAAVVIHVDKVDVVPGANQTVMVNVWGEDTTGDNEQLNAFTLALDAPTFSASGIHFVPPASGSFPTPGQEHPYVFGAFAGVTPDDFGSDAKRVQIGAGTVGRNDVADITPSLNGFFQLPVNIPASVTAPGLYAINIDTSALSLGGAGPAITATPSTVVGGINIVPEPASLGLIGLGGLLFLRRRRVA